MDERRVCYTEDSAPWAGFVTEVFTAFGFKVQHFETNDEAWENPETGIQNNPDLYDVYVFDNDTGPFGLSGVELIQKVTELPTDPDRRFLIIILSSSNPGLFSREDVSRLREKHDVQLCWKPDTFALQAAYAKDRLDNWGIMVGSFESWMAKTRGINPRDRDEISKQNSMVFEESFRRKRSA